jgi:hypothetical protein
VALILLFGTQVSDFQPETTIDCYFVQWAATAGSQARERFQET